MKVLVSKGWFFLLLLAHLSGRAAADEEVDLASGVFEWIDGATGGYFNPKLEVRREDPKDPSSPVGVFAKERLKKSETILTVPWHFLIESDDPDDGGQMPCGTVEHLARELKKNELSPYAPYIKYLHAQPADKLPSGWSDAGKAFIEAIVGGVNLKKPLIPPDEPTDWLKNDWYEICEGHPMDIMSSKAALLVVERSDDAAVVPGPDIIRHRNSGPISKFFNADTYFTEGVHHETTAIRDIEAGEEIHISLNFCATCEHRYTAYGTGEILRDYGFVEEYPQNFHYMNMEAQINVDVDENGFLKLMWHADVIPRDDDVEASKVVLRREIRRLRRVRNLDYINQPEDMPDYEWKMANEFIDSNLRAMALLIQELDVMGDAVKKVCTSDTSDEACLALKPTTNLTKDHYDTLEYEMDDNDYQEILCDNEEILQFNDYEKMDDVHTHFQHMTFQQEPDEDDVCLDLDNIVQICSSYRPHYHEYSVHGAARYLDEVKKVLFIGGGDSMLLHEILKYPTLELVVGLELDQIVTRKSFKYFHSSPHFDDPRVEWWFGDATKSLLLLPEEYWGTFDLVLIDLSETVMSLSVTSDLDVFDALALLLKPDGIMVKNELYFPYFEKMFDHAVQIKYTTPIICSQCMVMGSKGVDFMHKKPIDHGVSTLLYEGLHEDHNKFDYLHDYKKSYALNEGKCGDLPIRNDESNDQGRSAGILEIVEAEKCTAALDESLKDKLTEAITNLGFELVSKPIFDEGLIMVEMKEGYVMARLWSDQSYVGFDINLWGSFHKMKILSKGLVAAVGSSLVSNYRVVVGGMYGHSTWREDKKHIGPQIVQTRNCDEKPVPEGNMTNADLTEIMLLASLDLVHVKEGTAMVVCDSVKYCHAKSLLSMRTDVVADLHSIKSCSSLDEKDMDDVTKVLKMYECEKSQIDEMARVLGSSRLDLMVFDSEVSFEMFQIWNSILDSQRLRWKWFNKQHVVMASSTNPSEEAWRQHFLDRYRKTYNRDPIARGFYSLRSKDASLDFGVVSSEDEKIAYNLEALEYKVRDVMRDEEQEVDVELRAVIGGLFSFMKDWDPIPFVQADYEEDSLIMQYDEQQPLGRQVVYQLEPKDAETGELPTLDGIKSSVEVALEQINIQPLSSHIVSDVGDGAVLVFFLSLGQLVVVWDGQKHIDINWYMRIATNTMPDKFIGSVLRSLKPSMNIALRDEMPRGIGRVVNLVEDVGYSRPRFDFD